MSYAVRIHYPSRKGRAGKRDLVAAKPTRTAAVAYAKKVAKRGQQRFVASTGRFGKRTLRKLHAGRYSIRDNAPTACVYNLSKWGTKPVCFQMGWDESKHAPTVRQVAYTSR